MKDPIKFTDIESQGITIFLGIILIVMTFLLNSMFGLFWALLFAIVGILGIVLRARKRSVNVSQNDGDYFPRLNLNILKEFAKRVVNKYPSLPILKITLYRYHSKHFSNVTEKYTMVFEVDSTIKSSSELMTQFHKLQVATGWLGTVPDPDSSNDLGIDASFSDAYIEKPREDFLEEWNFFAKTSDEDMPLGIMVNEKSLSLYDSTT